MEHKNLQNLYQKAFRGIRQGSSYEKESILTGIPVELLRLEHIRDSRESEDYQQKIQKYALQLIETHGSRILSSDQINNLTKNVPYRFRSAVKHLICNVRKQMNGRKVNALSRIVN